jgi:hypothetical protein
MSPGTCIPNFKRIGEAVAEEKRLADFAEKLLLNSSKFEIFKKIKIYYDVFLQGTPVPNLKKIHAAVSEIQKFTPDDGRHPPETHYYMSLRRLKVS